MQREEAVELAREAVDLTTDWRAGDAVGAARFISLRAMWFRWSVGLVVLDPVSGEPQLRHAKVLLSDRAREVIDVDVPRQLPARGGRAFWAPPAPLWQRLALVLLTPLAVAWLLLCLPLIPLFWASDRLERAVVRLLTPRCPDCGAKLRTRKARRCFNPACPPKTASEASPSGAGGGGPRAPRAPRGSPA